MRRAIIALTVILAAPAFGAAPAAKPPVDKQRPTGKLALAKGALAPLPASEKAGWAHGPYSDGDCAICHERNDPKNPGAITMPTNELCYSCHEEFADLMNKRDHKHKTARESCSNCHNAHNSKERKLLHAEQKTLCLSCHDKIKTELATSKVTHDAIDKGSKCAACHNPHASNVEKLLVQLPFDLCVSCHSTDDLVDDKGVKLTNFKKLLAENPDHHAPIAAKDCSACHKPHGSENFRLLTMDYPAKFYSPYDPKLYALCYDCHNDQILATPETTKLTKFRDGSKNLHYVHVNKVERGRTCRACHEVHASKQKHHIRDAVPYGPKGYMLKINYTKTANGGSCAKTCHSTLEYDRKKGEVAAPPKK